VGPSTRALGRKTGGTERYRAEGREEGRISRKQHVGGGKTAVDHGTIAAAERKRDVPS